ncbi:PTS sugar transporter subunit IIB [Staphylococcus xylosus]|uniref:PTS sugar transporter subunit IIB n=1 Tax=Staphylococcus xylosus TaxID=1288 RepID=UPI002416D8FE|nr:PTS sugar transporter subunit IIB [Staphylococcus xylosus]MDG5479656.1 PTS sugar transporter subunit IIB [Staphylococcus xylosus]
MKILVVCGHGLGSSFMVEMNAQEALKNINASSDIKVEHSDVMSASLDMADLFICGRDLEENTKNLGDVIVLDNILDKEELQQKLKDKLSELNIL